MNNNYEVIKANPIKFIDDEIAKNPSANTNLPEYRDVIYSMQKQIDELQEKLSKEVRERESLYPVIDDFKATIERYRKAELLYEDKLHRRNLQIKDLKQQVTDLEIAVQTMQGAYEGLKSI